MTAGASTTDLGPVESFTDEEITFLQTYVSNTDRPVFALTNLPEVVKGALFARYSRSEKSLRRLLLDEFRADLEGNPVALHSEQSRAESLYDRVFGEYGDDSIAQLGSVHVACEGVSNIATKLLERGRLMSYLEQSTRYVPYTAKPGGQWKYHTPRDLEPTLAAHYRDVLDDAFSTYASLIPRMEEHLAERLGDGTPATSTGAFRRAVRAKALDLLRGMLPAATRSNVGVYGSGQAYEMLVMRLRASGNAEAALLADLLLVELRKVIPSFMARVDRPDRGGVWTDYLSDTRTRTRAVVQQLLEDTPMEDAREVTLVDFDPDGEVKVVAAALYRDSTLSDHQLLKVARQMTPAERTAVLDAYVGGRSNRRHRPGRAFERTSYRFDVLGEYGAFRDMQRHRLLSLDWQPLSTAHGYVTPPTVHEAGMTAAWDRVMERCAELADRVAAVLPEDGGYAVPMAYRIRYYMDMNAREAMHITELRSAEQGHENYRRVARQMHELIATEAGHPAIASAMTFVNYADGDLERLSSEAANDAARV